MLRNRLWTWLLFVLVLILPACTSAPMPAATLAPVSPTLVPPVEIASQATASPTSPPPSATSPSPSPISGSPTAPPIPSTAMATMTSVPPSPSILAATPTRAGPTRTAMPAAPTQVLPAACSDPDARINRLTFSTQVIKDFKTIPLVWGSVMVLTTAAGPNFAQWKMEYSGDEGKTWIAFYGPVRNQLPASTGGAGYPWETTNLADGTYWLRTVVIDNVGNFAEPCQFQVFVRNSSAPTVSPKAIACRDSAATITGPAQDSTILNGSAVLIGTIRGSNFDHYQIQYSADRKTWNNTFAAIREQRTDSILGS